MVVVCSVRSLKEADSVELLLCRFVFISFSLTFRVPGHNLMRLLASTNSRGFRLDEFIVFSARLSKVRINLRCTFQPTLGTNKTPNKIPDKTPNKTQLCLPPLQTS